VNQAEVTALVNAIKDNAQRLGLIWEIKIATVLQAEPIVLQFDGDTDAANSGITNITSLALTAGDRVYVFAVPPAGNYIISIAVPATPLVQTAYWISGTSVLAEVTETVATWNVAPTNFVFRSDRVFRATFEAGAYTLAAVARMALLRLRAGSLSGTILGSRSREVNLVFGVGGGINWDIAFTNSTDATITSSLEVTVVNPSGAVGSIGLYGDGDQRMELVVTDICSIAEYGGGALALPSIA
jgi:hypothetical protein